MYTKRNLSSAMFKASDIEKHFNIFGPAKGDIVRNAAKALEKAGKPIKVHVEHLGKCNRYTFELLELPKVTV